MTKIKLRFTCDAEGGTRPRAALMPPSRCRHAARRYSPYQRSYTPEVLPQQLAYPTPNALHP